MVVHFPLWRMFPKVKARIFKRRYMCSNWRNTIWPCSVRKKFLSCSEMLSQDFWEQFMPKEYIPISSDNSITKIFFSNSFSFGWIDCREIQLCLEWKHPAFFLGVIQVKGFYDHSTVTSCHLQHHQCKELKNGHSRFEDHK